MGEEPGKWKVGDALVEVWDAERADNPPPRTLIGKFFVYDGQRPVKAGARIFTYQELVDHPGGISWIQVPADHHLRSMRIAFGAGPSPRHLILMGRNGAGKTTLLRSLVEWLGQDNPWQNMTFQTLATLNVPIYYGRLGTFVPVGFTDQTTRLRVAANGGLFAYFPIQRSFSAAPVEGPKKEEVRISSPGQPGPMMMQHLVNERFEELLAREDGKEAEANRIRAWVERVERSFQKLTDSPSLRLVFERKPMSYAYALQMGERRIGLDQLPDGWSSLLAIVSELMIRQISMPGYGIVLIDEIDAHLHPELQRKVLGILTELFPTLQFIVTTHSPLVLTSAKNTQIYDLDDDETYDVEELRGKSFRSLLRAPFGLATDVDIDTEEKWSRWHTLFRMPSRSPSEQAELEQLDDVLSGRSALLRERMWHIKNIGEEEEGEE